MRKPTVSQKFSVLLAIYDSSRKEEVDRYLTEKKLNNGLIFMGKGTAESDIADMFGFGLSDKIILSLLVAEDKQDKVLEELTDFLGIERDTYGLTMLLETSSATTVVLDMLGIKVIR